jgi:hypothetical protein
MTGLVVMSQRGIGRDSGHTVDFRDASHLRTSLRVVARRSVPCSWRLFGWWPISFEAVRWMEGY